MWATGRVFTSTNLVMIKWQVVWSCVSYYHKHSFCKLVPKNCSSLTERGLCMREPCVSHDNLCLRTVHILVSPTSVSPAKVCLPWIIACEAACHGLCPVYGCGQISAPPTVQCPQPEEHALNGCRSAPLHHWSNEDLGKRHFHCLQGPPLGHTAFSGGKVSAVEVESLVQTIAYIPAYQHY